MGWTGQPAVFERQASDGTTRTWLVFGAYDGAVHFLDAETGEELLPPFRTGDLIKGSVTVDPDGYPLVHTGCRDDRSRLLSIGGDRSESRPAGQGCVSTVISRGYPYHYQKITY